MKPEGWGPWNVRAVNALVHLPSGLELRIGIRTPDGKEHWDLRWKQMERLGRLSELPQTDGGIFRSGTARLRVDRAILDLHFVARNDSIYYHLAPLEDTTDHALLMKLSYPWDAYLPRPEVSHLRADVTAEGNQGDTQGPLDWLVRQFTLRDLPRAKKLRPDGQAVELPWKDARALVLISGKLPEDQGSDASTIEERLSEFPTEIVKKAQAALALDPCATAYLDPAAELDEALWRGVAWNTIFHPRLKRLMTPVSRDWCVDENNFGDYVLFPWDTFFCSLLASRRDKDLANANVRAMLAEMTDRGMLPNVNGGAGQTLDRSQPPVGAYCVWKLHQKFNDLEFLAEVYPPLKRWHAFWMKYRDGNNDGLLEWGSDPIPAPVDWWKPHTQQAAKWESGLDNSPMYENIPFNEEANTLELADIGLSCLYAADADALANIAEALGLTDEAQTYRAEYAQVAKRINEDLWDEENGIYCNRHWDGRLSGRWSPTSFYALYAGVATPERAERCVREHLMNPDEFWGEWVIPSISRKDPNFPVQKYWQGRVWPPMNFLCYEGLRGCGFHAEADELAAKSEALFLKEWREEGHIHENYNAITADGDDVNPDDPEGSSDPIYTWGGLLAYIALDARERVQ